MTDPVLASIVSVSGAFLIAVAGHVFTKVVDGSGVVIRVEVSP